MPGSGGGSAWGAITGTLSAQTDLWSALGGKEPSITAGTTAQYWRGDKTWRTFTTDLWANLSASSPLSFNSATGAFSCSTCLTSNAVTSVFTRTGAVVAASGDYSAAQVTNAVDSTGSYSNPSWITGLAWSKITTGVPAFPVNTGAVSHQFFTAYNSTTGVFSAGQPAFTDISGALAHSQLPTLLSGDIPANAANTSGNAGTATALATTPALCTAPAVPTGVLASGNATGCAMPGVVAVVNLIGQTGPVAKTTLYAPVTGMYSLSVYVEVTSPGGTGCLIGDVYTFADSVGAQSFSSSNGPDLPCNTKVSGNPAGYYAFGLANFALPLQFYFVAGTNVTYQVTTAGTTTGLVFNYRLVLTRLN
jgi:hypothetical protein